MSAEQMAIEATIGVLLTGSIIAAALYVLSKGLDGISEKIKKYRSGK